MGEGHSRGMMGDGGSVKGGMRRSHSTLGQAASGQPEAGTHAGEARR